MVRASRPQWRGHSFAPLRVCDFFGFLAIFEHLTHLLSMALFGNIQKNHALSGQALPAHETETPALQWHEPPLNATEHAPTDA